MNKTKVRVAKKLNSHGFTLVEALVGGTLLAICAVILVTGFVSSLNIIARGSNIKNQGQIASSIIEGATITDPDIVKSTTPNVVMSYNIGNTQYEITGSYVSAIDNTAKVGFTIFVPENQ